MVWVVWPRRVMGRHGRFEHSRPIRKCSNRPMTFESNRISKLRMSLLSALSEMRNESNLRARMWRPSVADWGGGMSVCMLHRGSNCSLVRTVHGSIMRRGIISSCQSAATSEIVKLFAFGRSLTRVSTKHLFTFQCWIFRDGVSYPAWFRWK